MEPMDPMTTAFTVDALIEELKKLNPEARVFFALDWKDPHPVETLGYGYDSRTMKEQTYRVVLRRLVFG